MRNKSWNRRRRGALGRDPELAQLVEIIKLAAWHCDGGSRVMAQTYLRTVAHHARALVKHRFPEGGFR